MSATITRRPRAESDLVDIWSYIAEENETAADRLLARSKAFSPCSPSTRWPAARGPSCIKS